MIKICQSCKAKFEGRRHAKTCSDRCRKRLQRTKALLRSEAEAFKQSIVETERSVEEVVQSIKQDLSLEQLDPVTVRVEGSPDISDENLKAGHEWSSEPEFFDLSNAPPGSESYPQYQFPPVPKPGKRKNQLEVHEPSLSGLYRLKTGLTGAKKAGRPPKNRFHFGLAIFSLKKLKLRHLRRLTVIACSLAIVAIAAILWFRGSTENNFYQIRAQQQVTNVKITDINFRLGQLSDRVDSLQLAEDAQTTNLKNIDASGITTGTVSDKRLSSSVTLQGNSFNAAGELVQLAADGSLPALSGVNITNLNATNLASGTVADALLSTNVTLQGNTFNGVNQLVQLTVAGILPILNGSNLTNVNATTLGGNSSSFYTNASNISSGTLADARLSTNVTLQGNTFNGAGQLVQLTAGGALALSGLSASSINTGGNTLTITSSNFNTTTTGINSTAIGATTASTGAFTTISASGQITSTVATGTAPLVIASTTNVPNLNASSLNGATFAAPGAIGGGTAAAGTFTTLTSTSTTDLANAGASNVTIATTGTGTVAVGNATGTLALTGSNFTLSTAGVMTLAGAQAADITTLAGAAPTALVFQPGNRTTDATVGAALTIQAGNDSGVTTSTGGLLTIQGGNATGGGQTGGGVVIDSGTGTTGGIITIGGTNAASLALGRNGITTTNTGSLTVTQNLVVSTLGAAGSTALCQNGTSQVATCSATNVTGVTLQQAYAAGNTISLTDARDLAITAADTSTDPNVIFNLQCVTACGSNGRFAVQNAGSDVFTVNPSGGNIVFQPGGTGTTARVQIGAGFSVLASATPDLLVLDAKSTTGDPTGTTGAIYYNSAEHQFRCFRGIDATDTDGAWEPCGINPIDRGFEIDEDFFGGSTTTANGATGVGSQNWWMQSFTATTCSGGATYNAATPAVTADRPGIYEVTTAASINTGCRIGLASSTNNAMVLAAGNDMKMAVAPGSTTNIGLRVGISNNGGAPTAPTTGVWWQYDPVNSSPVSTNWQYCFNRNVAAPICADSATPVAGAANTFVTLEIRVNSTGVSGTADFYINGTKANASPITGGINTTSMVSPNFACYAVTGTGGLCAIDYAQIRGITSALR